MLGQSAFGLTPIGLADSAARGPAGQAVSLLLVINVEHAQSLPAEAWDVRVMLGGVDVSDRIAGEVTIEAEEDTARIATVRLFLVAGESFASLSGAVLLIDVQHTRLSAWVRRFTGRVALPEIDAETGIATLHGTDGRRDSLALATRTELDALLGGFWSPHVFARYADSLQYAQDRLSTLPAAYDLDVYGAPRLTPWASLASRLTLTDADLLDGSLAIQPAARQSVVNLVTNDNIGVQPVSTTPICHLADNKTLTTNSQPTLTGIAVPGMNIRVDIAGQVLTAVAGSTGSWSVTTKVLADGRYTPKVTLSAGAAACIMWGTPFQVARDGKGSAVTSESAMEQVVDCSMQYRYPRLHEYRRVINWSMGLSYGEFVRGRNGKPFKLPEKSLFRSAVESSGWKLRSEAWTAPLQGIQYVGYVDASGAIIEGNPSSSAVAILTFRNDYTGVPADDPRCAGAVLQLARRVVQSMTERWRITVQALDSVAALGTLKRQGQTVSMDASGLFDATAWTESTTMQPDIGTTTTDLTTLAGASRDDANLALQTLAAIARRQILASHRTTRVQFKAQSNPLLDVDMGVTLNSVDMLASGKVARLVEHYDTSAGSAITDVELAISGLVAAGTANSDPILAPELTSLPNMSQADSADLGTCLEGLGTYSATTTGYTTGAAGDSSSAYPHEVAIAVPDIPVFLTDPVSRELAYNISVAIPVDTLEMR